MIHFSDTQNFPLRLILSTLTGIHCRFTKINSNSTTPGLFDYQVDFLKFLEKLTNGSQIEINYTGTTLDYKPGVIVGGNISHDCIRSIGYYLEPICILAPFAKYPLNLSLSGITNDNIDITVDSIRTVLLPQLVKFGLNGMELKVKKRGAPPLGGGEISFSCPIIQKLSPIQSTDSGKIKRIRGLAYATRLSPQLANRTADSARSLLTRYIPDVYIYTDVYKGLESGNSPGYGLTLVAETTTGTLYSSEVCLEPPKKQVKKRAIDEKLLEELNADIEDDDDDSIKLSFETPEDLSKHAVGLLLDQIKAGGSFDSISQPLILSLMMLCPEDVVKCKLGKLEQKSIVLLRDLKKFFGTVFKIEQGNDGILITGVGSGYTNTFKKTS